MQIKKRDGSFETIDKSKIVASVERACKGYKAVDVQFIVDEAWLQLYDGMSTFEIDEATILATRSRIYTEPEYSYVAANLLLNVIYKEAFGRSVIDSRFRGDYRESFVDNLKLMVEAGRLSEDLLNKFDVWELAWNLSPHRDGDFKYIGLQTLYDRYFIQVDGRRMETPQAFWMRVAMGVSLNEANPTKAAIEAYELFSMFRYCPGTPTLFNSGTKTPQLSSCYLSTIEDSLDGIYGTIHNQARLSKYAGGLGVDWTPVRGLNSWIRGTNGPSQGTIPYLKVFNDTLVAVNQGSKRKGAGCAYLETWHSDILDFLELRKNTGDDRRRCHDMNTANWVPDLFMQKVEADEDWYLFSPNETPDLHEIYGDDFNRAYERYVEQGKQGQLKVFEVIKAKTLWKKMLTAIFETGHPWITFKDPSNLRYSNQHKGTVHSSNLCTEILLHTIPSVYDDGGVVQVGETAVCNLGSLNLEAHIENGQINLVLLRKTIKQAIRILDNVIDINFYPTKEAKQSNLIHRPVGLGLMGWSDYLHTQQIAFDSPEAIQLSSFVQEFISYHAIDSSIDLAIERGAYPSYEGSLWSQNKLPIDTYVDLMEYRGTKFDVEETQFWDYIREKLAKYGIRNSNVMAIAPTATISFIVGCSQSIEPDYSVLYTYSTLSGEFTMLNEYFVERLKKADLWTEEMIERIKQSDGDISSIEEINEDIRDEFKTAFDVDYEALIDVAAARQIWIDQGQSLNLYNKGTSLKQLNDMYFKAWKSGLKTTYYLRNKAASKVEKSTTLAQVEPELSCSIEAARNGTICESCQ